MVNILLIKSKGKPLPLQKNEIKIGKLTSFFSETKNYTSTLFSQKSIQLYNKILIILRNVTAYDLSLVGNYANLDILIEHLLDFSKIC